METIITKDFFNSKEEKGNVKIYLNGSRPSIAICVMCPEGNVFSFVAFIKALNNIKNHVDVGILKFSYMSDGILEQYVEEKLILSILEDFKIIFTDDKNTRLP